MPCVTNKPSSLCVPPAFEILWWWLFHLPHAAQHGRECRTVYLRFVFSLNSLQQILLMYFRTLLWVCVPNIQHDWLLISFPLVLKTWYCFSLGHIITWALMIQCLISLVCWHIACNCEFYRIVQTFCLLHFRYALHVWGYRTTPSLAHLWTALSCSAACWPKLTFSGQIGFVACLIKFSAFRNTWHHVFLCGTSSHEKKPHRYFLYISSLEG